ncbi:hypothetical protein Tco_0357497 [Tanacetum coccineum]
MPAYSIDSVRKVIPSPQPRPRKEGGVFERLGRKEPVTSARSDSHRRNPQAQRIDVETKKTFNKGKHFAVQLSQYRESEDSEGRPQEIQAKEGGNQPPMKIDLYCLGHVRKKSFHITDPAFQSPED